MLRRLVRCALLAGAGLSGTVPIAAATVLATVPPQVATAQPKAKATTSTSRSSAKQTSAKRGSAKRTSTKRPTLVSRLKTRVPVTRRPTADTVPTLPPMPSLLALFGPHPAGTTGTEASVVALAPTAPATGTGFGASAERLLSAMVDRARSQLGTRYVFGGNAPGAGLDCSSFARFAMEALGIQLPRTAAQQARVGTPVPRDRAQLRPGDLLTFGRGARVSHVGIYLGEGRFIHASVASGRIIETTIERNTQLFRRWQGARRLIADATGSDTTRRAF